MADNQIIDTVLVLTELFLAGLIRFYESGEEYTFTEKGLDYAVEQWNKLDDKLKLLFPLIINLVSEGDVEDI